MYSQVRFSYTKQNKTHEENLITFKLKTKGHKYYYVSFQILHSSTNFWTLLVQVNILVLRLKFLDPFFTWTKNLRFDDFYLNKLLFTHWIHCSTLKILGLCDCVKFCGYSSVVFKSFCRQLNYILVIL